MLGSGHVLLLLVVSGLTGCRAIFGSYEKADEDDAAVAGDSAADATSGDSFSAIDTTVIDTTVIDTTVTDTTVTDTSGSDVPAADTIGSESTAADSTPTDTTAAADSVALVDSVVRVDATTETSSETAAADSGQNAADTTVVETMPQPDGGPPLPPSCSGGLACGSESCCTSLSVPGGTFKRSYDGMNYTDPNYPATVSSFRLDKYEITVGRFRKFVDAVVGGWTPAAGSGKHMHLNGGNGLSTGGTSFEPGWDSAWTATHLPPSKTFWDDGTCYSACVERGGGDCSAGYETWTPSAGANENKPINCVNWYQAYAFCIWDGGFLPSEAEWNYAAANGTEQTVYPWGSTVPGANTNLAIYGCYYNGTGTCSGVQNIAPVGTVPAGNGKNWGHADLAGNVWEWTFDLTSTDAISGYPQPCSNCASTAGSNRVMRGGTFGGGAPYLRAGDRRSSTPTGRGGSLGARCARTP